MADWSTTVVKFLIELKKKDPDLVKVIRASVKRLEMSPSLGAYVRGTRYYYSDYDWGFRIGYNYHPEAESKQIEVAVIHTWPIN